MLSAQRPGIPVLLEKVQPELGLCRKRQQGKSNLPLSGSSFHHHLRGRRKLSIQDRVQILNCLSEGMGVNAAARMTGKSKNTVLKLLADVGEACAL